MRSMPVLPCGGALVLVLACTARADLHPAMAWPQDARKVAEEAMREWQRQGLSFRLETNCTVKPSLTFRWEDGDVFRDWSDKGGPDRSDAAAWWIGKKPTADWDTSKFPLGEIYINKSLYPTADRKGPDMFHIDPTPREDDGWKQDSAVPTYLTNTTTDYVFDNFDLLTVLKHEVGHFLGLGHSGNPKSVMYEEIRPGVRVHPTEDEIALARGGDYTYKFIDPVPAPAPAVLVVIGLMFLVGWMKGSRAGFDR